MLECSRPIMTAKCWSSTKPICSILPRVKIPMRWCCSHDLQCQPLLGTQSQKNSQQWAKPVGEDTREHTCCLAAKSKGALLWFNNSHQNRTGSIHVFMPCAQLVIASMIDIGLVVWCKLKVNSLVQSRWLCLQFMLMRNCAACLFARTYSSFSLVLVSSCMGVISRVLVWRIWLLRFLLSVPPLLSCYKCYL